MALIQAPATERPIALPPARQRSAVVQARLSNIRKALDTVKTERDLILASVDLERHRIREGRVNTQVIVARSRELVDESRELLADIERLFPTTGLRPVKNRL
jgi:hypothetical protein